MIFCKLLNESKMREVCFFSRLLKILNPLNPA